MPTSGPPVNGVVASRNGTAGKISRACCRRDGLSSVGHDPGGNTGLQRSDGDPPRAPFRYPDQMVIREGPQHIDRLAGTNRRNRETAHLRSVS